MKETDILVEQLKVMLIKTLGLPILPCDIDTDAPLFGAGIGVDSIDALELMVHIEKTFGVKIPDRQAGGEAFASVRALAAYIRKNGPQTDGSRAP